MTRVIRSLSALIVVLASAACTHSPQAATPSTAPSAKVADTKEALRDLWLGHILAIRNVAVATPKRCSIE